MNVVIYRKDVAGARPKLKKADRDRAVAVFEATCRVRRPSLEAFLADGFYSLPALTPSLIKNKAMRMLDHSGDGFVVPADSLGRSGVADASAVESINLWIKKNMAHLVNPDHVSVVGE